MWETPVGASTASTFSSLRRWRLTGASILVLLAMAATAAAQSRPGPHRDVQEPQVRRTLPVARATVFFCENSNVACRTGINDFKVDDLRDLYVFVAWGNLSGEHTQQLRFVLPNGDAYQTLESKFTTLASTNSENVQVAARSRGEPTVANVLPVAGTHISQRSLTGTWTVEVLLDGKLVTRTSLILRPREQQ